MFLRFLSSQDGGRKLSKHNSFALSFCYFESTRVQFCFSPADCCMSCYHDSSQVHADSQRIQTERGIDSSEEHSMKRLLCQWFPLCGTPTLLHLPPPPPPCTSPPSLPHSSKTEQKRTQKLLFLVLFPVNCCRYNKEPFSFSLHDSQNNCGKESLSRATQCELFFHPQCTEKIAPLS